MKNFRKFGAALTLAGFVATGMMASSARLHAAGPGTGGGRSNGIICGGLNVLYEGALAAGQVDYANSVFNYASSIGCNTTDW